MARIHGRTVQKNLHYPDNHDGVITHLEPDILECEVKWALGSIAMNKGSGDDGILVEQFQTQNMMLWKCCPQYASKFGKLCIGCKTAKGQFSFQSQTDVMPKYVRTTIQLHSPYTLAKKCSKFSKPGVNNTWTVNFKSLDCRSFRQDHSLNWMGPLKVLALQLASQLTELGCLLGVKWERIFCFFLEFWECLHQGTNQWFPFLHLLYVVGDLEWKFYSLLLTNNPF